MPEKILVVDDDVDSLKLIGLMLKRQGYEVVAANAGMPALQKAYAELPDLIILDVMMPDMDGFEVCRRLRAEPRTKDIPIIMFTAKTLVDDKVVGFEAGADDYLTKPTHPAELASRVKTNLMRRQQQRSTTPEAGAPSASSYIPSLSIGFLGVKGGVGTTTLAAAVGGLLAKEQETVLADLRPGQGSLGLFLGIQNGQGISNILGRYSPGDINPNLINNQAVRHNSGLRLLLSSFQPLESRLNITPEAASAMLKAMTSAARFSLIDMGAGLNQVSVRLIKELSQTVIIMEPNRASVALAQQILGEIKKTGVQPHKLNLVVFSRTPSSMQIAWQDVENMVGHQVTGLVSPAPETAYQAAEAGMPITVFQPDSVVSGQISKMVQELVKRGAA